MFAGLYVVVAGTKKSVASSEDLGDEGARVVLDVENWEGKRLPILDQIDIASDLGEGRWMIIFYHNGCAQCDEVIREADTMVKGRATAVALIEVPSHNNDGAEVAVRKGQKFVAGKLNASRRWVIQTPKVLLVERGVVTGAVALDGDGPPERTMKKE